MEMVFSTCMIQTCLVMKTGMESQLLKMNFPIILFEPRHAMKGTLVDTLVKRLQSVTMQMAVEI